jgi:hypothetical protein
MGGDSMHQKALKKWRRKPFKTTAKSDDDSEMPHVK